MNRLLSAFIRGIGRQLHPMTSVRISNTADTIEPRLQLLAILGALMDRVSHTDEEFSPAEERTMRRILASRGELTKREIDVVFAAAREASAQSYDVWGFTRHFRDAPYDERVKVIELLFIVGYADGNSRPRKWSSSARSPNCCG